MWNFNKLCLQAESMKTQNTLFIVCIICFLTVFQGKINLDIFLMYKLIGPAYSVIDTDIITQILTCPCQVCTVHITPIIAMWRNKNLSPTPDSDFVDSCQNIVFYLAILV